MDGLHATNLADLRTGLDALERRFRRLARLRRALFVLGLALVASIVVLGILRRGEPLLHIVLGIVAIVLGVRIDLGRRPRVLAAIDLAGRLASRTSPAAITSLDFTLDLGNTIRPGRRLAADPFCAKTPVASMPEDAPTPLDGKSWYENPWLSLGVTVDGVALVLRRIDRIEVTHWTRKGDSFRRHSMPQTAWVDEITVAVAEGEPDGYRSSAHHAFPDTKSAWRALEPPKKHLTSFMLERVETTPSTARLVVSRQQNVTGKMSGSEAPESSNEHVMNVMRQLYALAGLALPFGE